MAQPLLPRLIKLTRYDDTLKSDVEYTFFVSEWDQFQPEHHLFLTLFMHFKVLEPAKAKAMEVEHEGVYQHRGVLAVNRNSDKEIHEHLLDVLPL